MDGDGLQEGAFWGEHVFLFVGRRGRKEAVTAKEVGNETEP